MHCVSKKNIHNIFDYILKKDYQIFDALQLCCRRLWHNVLSVRLSSVSNGCIVAKRCVIRPGLLLITNRKSHVGFYMACKSLTLDDLEGQYCNKN